MEISEKYHPNKIVKTLSFKESMNLAYHLLLNEQRDDNLIEYATSLIKEIRIFYPKEWNNDWRNDVFLGDALYLAMIANASGKYENERYEVYKHAFEKISPTPPALLVSMARCYLLPNSPVTIEEAEKLILCALEKEESIEAVTLIRGICKRKGDTGQFTYWDKILNSLEERNAWMKDKWPDFLKE